MLTAYNQQYSTAVIPQLTEIPSLPVHIIMALFILTQYIVWIASNDIGLTTNFATVSQPLHMRHKHHSVLYSYHKPTFFH